VCIIVGNELGDPDGMLVVARNVVDITRQLVQQRELFRGRRLQISSDLTRPKVVWEQQDHTAGLYRIQLKIRAGDTFAFVYQLSHEIGHIVMGPARTTLMIEVLATALSLECLQQMGGDFQHHRTNCINWALAAWDDAVRDRLDRGDRVPVLTELRDAGINNGLANRQSRAWQHAAAVLLLEGPLAQEPVRWTNLSNLADATTPPPNENPTFRSDIPILDASIPAWIPDWLR